MKLTAEQHAVLYGHQKVLLYHMKCAEGHKAAYQCKALGFVEIVTFPEMRRGEFRRRPPSRVFHLEGDKRQFTTLAELADAIHDRRKLQQHREANLTFQSRSAADKLVG